MHLFWFQPKFSFAFGKRLPFYSHSPWPLVQNAFFSGSDVVSCKLPSLNFSISDFTSCISV